MRIVLIFLLAGICSTAAWGQEGKEPEFMGKKGPEFLGPRKMMGPMRHPIEDWAQQLNLMPEQQTRLQEMRETYLRDTLVWRNELVIKRFDLRNQLRNPQAEPDQVIAKQREISDLESKIQERTIRYQLEIRKVLTPEQIQRIPPEFGLERPGGPRMMRGWGMGMGMGKE